MYFGIWFVMLIFHWLYRSSSARFNGRQRGHVTFEPLTEPTTTRASFQMSLMKHLIDENDNADKGIHRHAHESERSSDSISLAPANEVGSEKQLCRRFRFLRAFEFLLLFSYQTLTEQALQLVNCVGVGSCGNVLAEYPDVSCRDNAQYTSLLVVAIYVLIYSVVFPVWLFISLHKLHHRFESKTAINDRPQTSSNDHQDHQHPTITREEQLAKAKFGVFYNQFKPQFWWWEIQVSWCCCCFALQTFVFVCFLNAVSQQILAHHKKVLFRRVLILVVYVAKYRSVAQRSYGVLVLNGFFALLHVNFQPFKHFSDNVAETISLSMLTYAASTKASFDDGELRAWVYFVCFWMYAKKNKYICVVKLIIVFNRSWSWCHAWSYYFGNVLHGAGCWNRACS